jgi:hypothetical protein
VRFPTLYRNAGVCIALYSLSIAGASGVQPFTSATVMRVENSVSIGSTAAGNGERPAALHDVVQAESYLITKDNSRAELEFPDHSIVRVGQDTVFSFDANSRTLSLEKGAMLFYVPPGHGGGQIKTPSLTAAITGTVAKVSKNMIAVLSGEVKTKWGLIHAGQALDFMNGNVQIFQFDPSQAMAGHLVAFGGPLPELPQIGGESNKVYKEPDLNNVNTVGINQVDFRFIRPSTRIVIPRRPGQVGGGSPPYP